MSVNEIENEMVSQVSAQKKREDGHVHCITIWNVLEVILLIPVILIIIGLLQIPTILYARSTSSQVSNRIIFGDQLNILFSLGGQIEHCVSL